MWENILMMVHEWCFYPCSWMSTLNLFMNGSFISVHKWLIKSRNEIIVWDIISWLFMNNVSSRVDECHILIHSWMFHFFLFMNSSSSNEENRNHNVGEYFDDRSWMMLLSMFMNTNFQPIHEWFLFTCSWMV